MFKNITKLGLICILGSTFLLSFIYSKDKTLQDAINDPVLLFSYSCSKCHTIGQGKRVGPDLYNITKQKEQQKLIDFILTASSKTDATSKNQKCVIDLELNSNQTEKVLGYIDQASSYLLAYDIKISNKHSLYNDSVEAYIPPQQLNFSHKIHANKLQISCLHCHPDAVQTIKAGVPTLDTCMDCHHIITTNRDDDEELTEIKSLLDLWQQRKDSSDLNISWEKRIELPDFVDFKHNTHVQNNITCQECHGSIEKFDELPLVGSISMQWCITCHWQDENNSPVYWKVAHGGVECTRCHERKE